MTELALPSSLYRAKIRSPESCIPSCLHSRIGRQIEFNEHPPGGTN